MNKIMIFIQHKNFNEALRAKKLFLSNAKN